MEFNAAQVKTEFLGHLGILTAVIERLGIVEKVNARISVSKEKGVKSEHGYAFIFHDSQCFGIYRS